MTTETMHNACPYCLSEHDAVTGANTDESPEPGDLTICVRCGHVAVYDERMQMRVLDLRDAEASVQRAAFSARQAWLDVMLDDACDYCLVDFAIHRAFVRCCDDCNRHVVPHRGCVLRSPS